MIKISYDLDGVIRDLNAHLLEFYGVPMPHDWKWTHEGKNIYDWAKKDRYRILKEANETEYFDTILRFNKEPEIWTHQPTDWREPTCHWIRTHIGRCTVFYLTNVEKRARLDAEQDTWLVEDNPLFSSYERILLIDRLYNQKVETPFRMKSPYELNQALIALKMLDCRTLNRREISYGKSLTPFAKKVLKRAKRGA
jgi:hypothetical protein